MYDELLDQSVAMFVSVLSPHTELSEVEATILCIGLVGAGKALSSAIVKRKVTETDAIATFAATIKGVLGIVGIDLPVSRRLKKPT